LPNLAIDDTLATMSTMNISLPDAMKTFVDEQVAQGGYSTSSEYMRELIRKEQDRQHLRKLILDGARSPIVGEADHAWVESLRERARSRGTAESLPTARRPRPTRAR